MTILFDSTKKVNRNRRFGQYDPPTDADEAAWAAMTAPVAEARGEFEVVDRICFACGRWQSQHGRRTEGGGK